MGEMASMLAHEINQPLSAIANYCSGCVARLEGGAAGEAVLPAMKKASAQAERAGKIIRRIREFVKKSEPRRVAVQVAAILDDALGFAEIDAHRLDIRLEAIMSSETDHFLSHLKKSSLSEFIIVELGSLALRKGIANKRHFVEWNTFIIPRGRSSPIASRQYNKRPQQDGQIYAVISQKKGFLY
jgi:signal transduction histidine kinase